MYYSHHFQGHLLENDVTNMVYGKMASHSRIRQLQLKHIREFLEFGSFHSSVLPNHRTAIKQASDKFILEGKILFYIGHEKNEKRLVLFTAEEKEKVLRECHHCVQTKTHFGRTRTLMRLKEKYYWTNMVEDVVSTIVSLDIVGQFVCTERGHAFVAIMVDMFSKFTVAIPLRDTRIIDLSQAVMEVVYKFGSPKWIISDQGNYIINQLNNALQDAGIASCIFTVSQSEMNRLDETAIKMAILEHCQNSGTLWDIKLAKEISDLNSHVIMSSGYTPFYLMFHRNPRTNVNDVEERLKGKLTFTVQDVSAIHNIKQERSHTSEISKTNGSSEEEMNESELTPFESIDLVTSGFLNMEESIHLIIN